MKRLLFSVTLFFVGSSCLQASENESWISGLELGSVVSTLFSRPTYSSDQLVLQQEMGKLDEERNHYANLRECYIKQLQTIVPPKDSGVESYYLHLYKVSGEPSQHAKQSHEAWLVDVMNNPEAAKIATRLNGIEKLRVKNRMHWHSCDKMLSGDKHSMVEKIAKDLAQPKVVYHFTGWLAGER